VYCLDAISGEKLWEFLTVGQVYSSPAVSNGYLYIGSLLGDNNQIGGMFYCLNAVNGSLVWSKDVARTYSAPCVSNNLVYFVTHDDGMLYCLNTSTGETVWNFTMPGYGGFSSPSFANGKIYVTAGDGYIAQENRVYCIDAISGKVYWDVMIGLGPLSVIIGCDKLYLGAEDYHIYCLNASDGSTEWTFATDMWAQTIPALTHDYVYVTSRDKYAYCLNRESGSLVWKSQTLGSGAMQSPVVVNGLVYVLTLENGLYCLESATGDTGYWPMFKQDPSHQGYWCEPTAIELSDFSAESENKMVILNWLTESETDNAGFNIWRKGEYYKKINTSLIPAKGSTTTGSRYEFVDKNVLNRHNYFYILEDIDQNGVSTFHGPVQATPRFVYHFSK
jgi:outer membrane protein assembly factor BamB